MTGRLDKLTNIAAFTMFILVSILAATKLLGTGSAASGGRTVVPYVAGKPTDLLPSAYFKQADRTVLIVVQSRCGYCTESMPFYARLLSQRSADQPPVRFVAMTLDPVSVGRSYLAEHAVRVDDVVRFPISRVDRIFGTPTVIVVDASGIVVGNWNGKLSAAQEREVELAIQTSSSSTRPIER